MKFIVRYKNELKINITLEPNSTFGQMKAVIFDHLQQSTISKSSQLVLSLNGEVPIDADDSFLIESLDIVTGDIIWILNKLNISMLEHDLNPCNLNKNLNWSNIPMCLLTNNKNYPTKEYEFKRILEEPFLVHESSRGKLPIGLETLLKISNAVLDNDNLIIILHYLMLEAGFQYSGNIVNLPLGWKQEKFYCINYVVSLYPDTTCKLIIVPMEAKFVAHGIIQTYCFSYIISTEQYLLKDAHSTSLKFTNLSLLSCKFKDNIAFPLMQKFRDIVGLPLLGIYSLPQELLLFLIMYLDVKTIIRFASTCNEFQWINTDEQLWNKLVLRDFPKQSKGVHPKYGWKHLYKDVFQRRMSYRVIRYHPHWRNISILPPWRISTPNRPWTFNHHFYMP